MPSSDQYNRVVLLRCRSDASIMYRIFLSVKVCFLDLGPHAPVARDCVSEKVLIQSHGPRHGSGYLTQIGFQASYEGSLIGCWLSPSASMIQIWRLPLRLEENTI